MVLSQMVEIRKALVSSDSCLFRVHIQVPVNAAVLSIALDKPLIALGEVMALKLVRVSSSTKSTIVKNTYETSRSTQRTRMNALEDEMLVRWNALRPVLCRRAPSKENYTVRPHFGHRINHLLRQQLPTLA